MKNKQNIEPLKQKWNQVLDGVEKSLKLLPFGAADALASLDNIRKISSAQIDNAVLKVSSKIFKGLDNLAPHVIGVRPSQSVTVRRLTEEVVQASGFDRWQARMAREGFDKEALELGAKKIESEDFVRKMEETKRMAKVWADELLEDPNLPKNIREFAENNPKKFIKKLETFGEKPSYKYMQQDEKIYRVINDESGYDGGFWSPEPPPKQEEIWRARDAVRNDWNQGGAYVVAKAPPPEAVLVGSIAPQNLEMYSEAKKGWYLEGGGTQYFVVEYPAINKEQILSWHYTHWNAPKLSTGTTYCAGQIGDCDQ